MWQPRPFPIISQIEAEESMSLETIPEIESVFADLLFASWLSQRGLTASGAAGHAA